MAIKVESPRLGSFERRFSARGLVGAHVHVPLVGRPTGHPVLFDFYKGTRLWLPESVVGVKLFGDLLVPLGGSSAFSLVAQ